MIQYHAAGDWARALIDLPRPLGIVLTMGAIHAGHIRLIEEAKDECSSVVATIFVNPKQFGVGEDLNNYPRPISADINLLEQSGVDAVFCPSVDEIYPESFSTSIKPGGPAFRFEADQRPGHFDGVSTVVVKLLNQARADRAYFGRKDAQQVAVIKHVLSDLSVPTSVVVVPTARDRDGLAISSRNQYLSDSDRARAINLFRALSAARDRFRSGVDNRTELESACRNMLTVSSAFDAIDYVAAVHPDTMQDWQGNGPGLLIAAARIGDVRLLDNVVLD